jgi:pyrroloquinoline quinone (PQQ) biosynthesis protein C
MTPSCDDGTSFELRIRELIDAKYDRDPDTAGAWFRLFSGQMSQAECLAQYRPTWPRVLAFNRVILPQAIAKAPDLRLRVELMAVIGVEYGPDRLEDAHPVYFRNFLLGLGAAEGELPWGTGEEDPSLQEHLIWFRRMSWCEILATLLFYESFGPVTFRSLARTLKQEYALPARALQYFRVHAVHDKRDTEILFDLLRREARSEADQNAVVDVLDQLFDHPRFRQRACRLPGTTEYRFAARFRADRRRQDERAADV